ncbi:malto-oligosyltrehalose synthase [Erythrobacter sp.]|uniref:malto-oligosyltrehalose synthase n=1 Tax=Erythrobacter sp. TaxID=1042 RepID=UPI0025E2D7B9|nr:malto-oligosyltrehalose synthase [Erythrobacter sp.]
MIPRATYRLQFHPGFTLDDARRIVPYLADLGVSHIYCSPLAEARSGSTHGYDVTDPARISACLGGEEALRALAGDLAACGMGLILDIVPNHMAASPENPWWADVLRHGKASDYARFFDIDWSRHDRRILLPVLGAPLEEALAAGDIAVYDTDGGPVLRLYGEQDYPLAPGTGGEGDCAAILAQQHYRLAWWRRGHDELNWRRFFSISELVGLRIEDEAVFDAVHSLPLRLYREGVIDGLRIDHIDGLTDPAAYLKTLRKRLEAAGRDDGPAWLVVEKILAADETLPADWPVDGTTGYDFMEEVSLLLHAPDAGDILGQDWSRLSGRPADFEHEERLARRQLLQWEFGSQFDACVDAVAALAQRTPATARHSRAAWGRAVEALLIAFPAYRTYGTGSSAPPEDARTRAEAARDLPALAPPGEAALGHAILGWLAGDGPAAEHAAEFVQRFQQLSAPIAAKAVEDTAFYRNGRLISRNDVGFAPARFSAPPDAFHEWQEARAAHWPRSMLTTATHDHKRGEDVRARLFAISEVAEEWTGLSTGWRQAWPQADRIDPGDLAMLLQAVVGAWPDEAAELPHYAERLRGYAVKILREAKLRSSWTAPDEAYEKIVTDAVEGLVSSEEASALRAEIGDFLESIRPAERVKRLAQLFLRLTCPGIPDTYQGTELADGSLVDPDNRRAVDFAVRQRIMKEAGDEKLGLLRDLLHLRARHPAAFEGGYQRISSEPDCLAFARGTGAQRLVMVTALRSKAGSPRDWVKGVIGSEAKSLIGPTLPCAIFAM